MKKAVCPDSSHEPEGGHFVLGVNSMRDALEVLEVGGGLCRWGRERHCHNRRQTVQIDDCNGQDR